VKEQGRDLSDRAANPATETFVAHCPRGEVRYLVADAGIELGGTLAVNTGGGSHGRDR
jgi:hypothetical protein